MPLCCIQAAGFPASYLIGPISNGPPKRVCWRHLLDHVAVTDAHAHFLEHVSRGLLCRQLDRHLHLHTRADASACSLTLAVRDIFCRCRLQRLAQGAKGFRKPRTRTGDSGRRQVHSGRKLQRKRDLPPPTSVSSRRSSRMLQPLPSFLVALERPLANPEERVPLMSEKRLRTADASSACLPAQFKPPVELQGGRARGPTRSGEGASPPV